MSRRSKRHHSIDSTSTAITHNYTKPNSDAPFRIASADSDADVYHRMYMSQRGRAMLCASLQLASTVQYLARSLLLLVTSASRYDTIRYDSVYLTCNKKLTGSQLSLPHETNKKLKCKTKNKMMSVIGPVQSRYREADQQVKEIYGGKDLLKRQVLSME